MKNFDIFGVHWKIQFLGGGVHKKKIEGGLPKRGGGLKQFADWREDLAKKRGESLIPLYTLFIRSLEATINKCSIIGGVMVKCQCYSSVRSC